MRYTSGSTIQESGHACSGTVLDFNESNMIVDTEKGNLSIKSATLTLVFCDSRRFILCDGTPVCT